MADHDEQQKYFSFSTDVYGEVFIQSPNEVLVVPLDADDALLLAMEPSPALGEDVLILPGGTAADEEPTAETANRELQEELGFKAQRLDFLGELRPWSKYLTVRSYVYLARDLIPSNLQGDERVPVGLIRVPWRNIDSLLESGRLRDARAIAGLYLASRFLQQPNSTTS